MSNEAAERLRTDLSPADNLFRLWRQDKYRTTAQAKAFIDEALAAERRATVQRIRTRIGEPWMGYATAQRLHDILDEEAAR